MWMKWLMSVLLQHQAKPGRSDMTTVEGLMHSTGCCFCWVGKALVMHARCMNLHTAHTLTAGSQEHQKCTRKLIQKFNNNKSSKIQVLQKIISGIKSLKHTQNEKVY